MAPVNKTLIYRCSMFTATRSLWYKKLCPVFLNHLSKSIAHDTTLAAGTDVAVRAPAADILLQ